MCDADLLNKICILLFRRWPVVSVLNIDSVTFLCLLDLFKPAIAHRDLNTRNILVNPDLTCVIVDLGFSVGMIGSRIIKNGVAENAEQATLADVSLIELWLPFII